MDEKKIKQMYSLGCGETMYCNEYLITRVPGGWMWTARQRSGPPVFVPFSNEYMQLESTDE